MHLSALLHAAAVSGPEASTFADMARLARELGASPVVAAMPDGVDAPPDTRVVRTRAGAAPIAAIRFGMAQLTNTTATAVVLWPLGAALPSVDSLLALVVAAASAPMAIVAFAGESLDASPVIVPRDAWLELVTLGEGGLDAVAARRAVVRVERVERARE